MTRDPEPWWLSARCAETDPELFTPNPGDSVTAAKRIYAGCPVINQCLTDALITNDQFGVRGGLTANERRQIRRGAA